MKKFLLTLLILIPVSIHAQSSLGFDVGGVTLELPTFFSLSYIQNFSVFSYAAFFINMIFVGITIVWIFRLLGASANYIKSQGDAGEIEKSVEKLQNIFVGIGFLFGYFIVLILVGAFFNLGSFLDWPKYLSYCQDGSLYIAKSLEEDNVNLSPAELEVKCFRGVNSDRSACILVCQAAGDPISVCNRRCNQ